MKKASLMILGFLAILVTVVGYQWSKTNPHNTDNAAVIDSVNSKSADSTLVQDSTAR